MDVITKKRKVKLIADLILATCLLLPLIYVLFTCEATP